MDPHQIWTVDVFHHAPLIHGIQDAEMQKKFFVTSTLLYSIRASSACVIMDQPCQTIKQTNKQILHSFSNAKHASFIVV